MTRSKNTGVGIDVGTQSLKVVFYDFESKTIVASASQSLDLYQNDQGAAEQQASWWIAALKTSLSRIDAGIRSSASVIGVSGQQHGFVPVDASGEVLAPVKLWCDTSTDPECDEIMRNAGGPEACLEAAGNLVLPGYTASKIRWLKNNKPEIYGRMATVLLPHDYLNFYLTGERTMEMGDASGTAMLDVRRRRWSDTMLAAVDDERDLAACLPEPKQDVGLVGTLLPQRADELGLAAGIPVATGGGDNMMGAVGTGNVRQGILTMSLGTSGTVYAYSDEPVVDPAGNIAAFCSSTGGWLPLLCTMNCTVTTELVRGLLDTELKAFESAVSAAAPGADGVLTLPFFNGERTPNLPNAKGALFGLDPRNATRENLLRSSMEGATFALRFGVEELGRLGIDAGEIVLTGGGAGSATWRQAVADICNLPVTVLKQDEGAALGAALQALAALQGVDIVDLVADHLARDQRRSCEPHRETARLYDAAYARLP